MNNNHNNVSDISRQIEKQIKSGITSIKEEFKKLKKLEDKDMELDLLDSYIELLSRENSLSKAIEIFRSITIAGNIESELDIIYDQLTTNLSKNQGKISIPSAQMNMLGLVGNLKAKIKKLSVRLWQFLSQMMNLNEWSVSGSSNLNICGFHGGVTLQLNFRA